MDNVKPQEAWNMATETLKRLSRSLDMCSFFSQRGWMIRWFDVTMDLRRNLMPFMTTEEIKSVNDKLTEFPRGWILFRTESSDAGGKVNGKHYATAHRILDEIYILFITYMKEKGLLMPKTQDPRAAVLNN